MAIRVEERSKHHKKAWRPSSISIPDGLESFDIAAAYARLNQVIKPSEYTRIRFIRESDNAVMTLAQIAGQPPTHPPISESTKRKNKKGIYHK